jgi:S-adenosylmethionine:tRNA ribosyltransferase-isomerase
MKRTDFSFDLPPELIAQSPIVERDHSRLLCLDKKTGSISHHFFYDLPSFLDEGDCLVINDSRVLPARLLGNRNNGGAAEILLLRDLGGDDWECLCRPGKKLREGSRVSFGEGQLTCEIMEILSGGNRRVHFSYQGIFLEILDQLGKMPLPPYIKKELADKERYQTVYSRVLGSAAAPTAGLHFTEQLLREIQEKGVMICPLTLHVGLGTFRPVKEEEIEHHEMHSEFCTIPDDTACAVNVAKAAGKRIIAVGTTSCRTLESFAEEDGTVSPGSKWTDIFIYPGYRFRCIDALVTNFHLPESSLIMLVSALAGRENVLAAYEEAVKEKYYFFSFGDAMFIS